MTNSEARKRAQEAGEAAKNSISRPASPQPTNSPSDALAGSQGVEAIRAKIRATPKRSGSCCIQAGIPDHGCPERPFYGDADELELLLAALDESRAEVRSLRRTRPDRALLAPTPAPETAREGFPVPTDAATLLDLGCTCHRSAVDPCAVHGTLDEQVSALRSRLDTDRNSDARSDLYAALGTYRIATGFGGRRAPAPTPPTTVQVDEGLDSVRGQSDDPAVVQHRLSKLLDALAANPGTSRHAADIRAYQADAARRHWLLETLERAAEEWDAKPEWTKPVVNAPYYAQRADQGATQGEPMSNNPPTTSPDPTRLRSGASAIREIVGPDAVVMNAIAEGLDNDADRLEMGEPVTDLQASLDLADSFASEAGGEG